MKNLKLTFLALFVCGIAQAQITLPQPSPAGSVYSRVGLTDVTIDYFRPKVKGRKIFGEGDQFLQPYGQLWRTGANSGTKLKLSTAAKISGQDVEAGEYLILSTPGATEWTFFVYGDPSIGGNMAAFKEEDVVVKATVKPTKLAQPVEALTFNISDISEDNTSANIHFTWSDVSYKVPIEVSFEESIMKEIATKTQVNPVNYIQAANYYYNTGKDLKQALEWVNLYLAQGNNAQQFWNVHLKAQIQTKLGMKKEALATAQKSLDAAKASEQGDFGYIARNESLIAELKKK